MRDSHSDSAIEQMQNEEQDRQEELYRDVERVVTIACQHLGPNDQAFLRWATGIQAAEPDPRQMTVWNPDSEEPPF